MNPRINYTLVGAFVVLLLLMGLGMIAWMTQDKRQQERQLYLTYFTESVAGLNERASVRYLGVPVGIVERISLDTDVEGRVRLDLRIDPETPIRENSVASLQNQGITGLLFVEINGGDGQSPYLETSDEDPAVIGSKASRLLQITDALSDSLERFNDLAENLNELTRQISQLTDAEMKQQLSDMLAAVESLASTADQQVAQLDLKPYEEMAQALTDFTRQLQTQSEDWPLAIEQMGQNLADSLSQSMDKATRQIELFSRDGQATTRQLPAMLEELETLLEQFKRESNSLITGPATLPPGPGENP
ncbi:MlaD family protein [Nitrincola sp. MINF-07-Sa-05]|uniref:MlaD family protein n=1 Tax=Nitrincola salilacus TaxID=3400273 RepID=UPI003917FC1F